jgi:hypothetical protein
MYNFIKIKMITQNTKIITLGSCCSVTNAMIDLNIRNENSLFEWMMSVDFRDILFILSKVMSGEKIQIEKKYKKWYFKDTDIHSKHYNYDCKKVFEEKIQRRANRLREWITKYNIIFIRHDARRQTTDDDISEFWSIFGVNNKIKLLLFIPPTLYNNNKLQDNRVIRKMLPRIVDKSYFQCIRDALQ